MKSDDLIIEDMQSRDFDEEGQLNTFIIDYLIKFFSAILIESTYFLMIDELCDFSGFSPYSRENRLDYVKAAYFTIVSFSTIGYGDILPN
jgi:hypothetical protein